MFAFGSRGQGNGQGRAAPAPRGWGGHGVALGWAEGLAVMRRYQSPVEYRAEMFRLALALTFLQPMAQRGWRDSTLPCLGGANLNQRRPPATKGGQNDEQAGDFEPTTWKRCQPGRIAGRLPWWGRQGRQSRREAAWANRYLTLRVVVKPHILLRGRAAACLLSFWVWAN